jgi:hypothetical protein
MQSAGKASSGVEDMIIQLVPITILAIIYAIVVFIIARKRGINPWPWTIGSVVPFVGQIIVAPVFLLLSFLSVFDRLNALEARGPH